MTRLTAGCLTIRLRWNSRLAARASPPARRPSGPRHARGEPFIDAKFSRSRDGTRERVSPRWFRVQGSNLSFWVQRPVSCQLDDPGVKCVT